MIFLAPILARYGLHIGLAIGCLVAFLAWDSSRVNKGRQIERAAIEKRGEINAKKADAARRDAERIPVQRLCDKYARDC
jgi:hypothetical protein